MQPSEADGTGHPSRHGFKKCDLCRAWRRSDLPGGYCEGSAWEFCVREQARRLPVRHADSPMGWDANGAPTGIDANGDAA